MKSHEEILSEFSISLKLRGLSLVTQKHYLRNAQDFLVWAESNHKEPKIEIIDEHLSFLMSNRGIELSTTQPRRTAILQLFAIITGDKTFLPQPRGKFIENGCLKFDREAFIEYLLDMKYSPKSLLNYKWTINCLERFMTVRGLKNYSSDIGKSFLTDVAESEYHTTGVHSMMTYTIRRFDCFMEQVKYIYRMPSISRKIPTQFVKYFKKYLNSLHRRGLKESTIENHRYNLQKALTKLDSAGIRNFNEIKPGAIYDVFSQTRDKGGFATSMRGLLRFLYECKAVKFDYSEIVPTVRKSRPVPTIYTATETKSLLECGESNPRSAKRNKAIILLALRLGMRSGDIANLKFTNVDFNTKTISFIQEKTNVPHRLELLPEVEKALLEYISTARQESNSPHIFLSVKSPIKPTSQRAIYDLISIRFEKAGIVANGRARGGHALRSTLASELVAEKIPYVAVRKILGHEDPFVIKHYVGFDVAELRSCAIDTPPVGGKLAEYMTTRGGVTV
jgi:integrase